MPYRFDFEVHSDFLLSLDAASKGHKDVERAIWNRLRQIQKHLLRHGNVPPDTTSSQGVSVHTFEIKPRANWKVLARLQKWLFPTDPLDVYFISFEFNKKLGRVRFTEAGLYWEFLVKEFQNRN